MFHESLNEIGVLPDLQTIVWDYTCRTFSFSSEGKAQGELHRPDGISVDSKGRVYVSDSSDRVQIFDYGGTFLREIVSAPPGSPGHFRAPTRVAVSPDGLIYIFGSHTRTSPGVVRVYQYEGNFLRSIDVARAGDAELTYSDFNPRALGKWHSIQTEAWSTWRVQ